MIFAVLKFPKVRNGWGGESKTTYRWHIHSVNPTVAKYWNKTTRPTVKITSEVGWYAFLQHSVGLCVILFSCTTKTLFQFCSTHGRPHIAAQGVSWPCWKNGWKTKKRKHAKRWVFYVYVIFWEQSGQAGVENGAMLTTYLLRYTSECTIS